MNTKKDLIERVKKVKKYLKFHDIKDAKRNFIDSAYGALYQAESTRVDNLWQCKITDEDFTTKLELFAENPERYIGNSAEFKRFMDFVNWYMKQGGRSLTEEDIEKVYPKFQN